MNPINENKLTDKEDRQQYEFEGKKLPVFHVYPHCTLQETCAEPCGEDDSIYSIDATAGRAIVLKQPRTEDELEHHRRMCIACPVEAIKEAQDWDSFPTDKEAKPK